MFLSPERIPKLSGERCFPALSGSLNYLENVVPSPEQIPKLSGERCFPDLNYLRSEPLEIRGSELGTLEWWISGLMLDPLFFLISRLNMACSPIVINLQINEQIGILGYPILKFSALVK